MVGLMTSLCIILNVIITVHIIINVHTIVIINITVIYIIIIVITIIITINTISVDATENCMVLNDNDLEVRPEFERVLESLLARPDADDGAHVLHPLPVYEGGKGECLLVPHDLPGLPGLEEGGDHLLPPVDVVAHPVVVETCLGEAVGPDCLYGSKESSQY